MLGVGADMTLWMLGTVGYVVMGLLTSRATLHRNQNLKADNKDYWSPREAAICSGLFWPMILPVKLLGVLLISPAIVVGRLFYENPRERKLRKSPPPPEELAA